MIFLNQFFNHRNLTSLSHYFCASLEVNGNLTTPHQEALQLHLLDGTRQDSRRDLDGFGHGVLGRETPGDIDRVVTHVVVPRLVGDESGVEAIDLGAVDGIVGGQLLGEILPRVVLVLGKDVDPAHLNIQVSERNAAGRRPGLGSERRAVSGNGSGGGTGVVGASADVGHDDEVLGVGHTVRQQARHLALQSTGSSRARHIDGVVVQIVVTDGLDLVEGEVGLLLHGVEGVQGGVETAAAESWVLDKRLGITSDIGGQGEGVRAVATTTKGISKKLSQLVQSVAGLGSVGNHQGAVAVGQDILLNGHIRDNATIGGHVEIMGSQVQVESKTDEGTLDKRELVKEISHVLETDDRRDEPIFGVDVRSCAKTEVVEAILSGLGRRHERGDGGGGDGVQRQAILLSPEVSLVVGLVVHGVPRVDRGRGLGQITVIQDTVATGIGGGLGTVLARQERVGVETDEGAILLQRLLGERSEEFVVDVVM